MTTSNKVIGGVIAAATVVGAGILGVAQLSGVDTVGNADAGVDAGRPVEMRWCGEGVYVPHGADCPTIRQAPLQTPIQLPPVDPGN